MIQCILLDANSEVPEQRQLSCGTVVLFSTRSPAKDATKDTANEDALALIEVSDSSAVLAIADGCGGMASGELAAKLTIESVVENLQDTEKIATENLRSRILDAIEQANQRVCQTGQGSATTLALVEIDQGYVRPYHVGDSGILVVGNRGKIKLKTIDHSPVGYAVEAGIIDAQEAIHHEDRHLVSNVIGDPEARIEIGSPRKLLIRDTVIMGSDGLFDNMHVAEIVEIARKGDLLRAARKIVKLVRQRMDQPNDGLPSKPDDLTFILYRRRR